MPTTLNSNKSKQKVSGQEWFLIIVLLAVAGCFAFMSYQVYQENQTMKPYLQRFDASYEVVIDDLRSDSFDRNKLDHDALQNSRAAQDLLPFYDNDHPGIATYTTFLVILPTIGAVDFNVSKQAAADVLRDLKKRID